MAEPFRLDELEQIFRRAVAGADPALAIERALEGRSRLAERVGVLAVGKCAVGMWRGAERTLGSRISESLIIHPIESVCAEPAAASVAFVAASHPIPDHLSLAAATTALVFVTKRRPPESLLVLISGGASALMERPIDGLALDTFCKAIADLQQHGPSIHELNYLRCCLSSVKGGRLVQDCRVPVETLVISDVPDDELGVVGSGPTIPLASQSPPDRVEDWLENAQLPAACKAAVRSPRFLPPRLQHRARLVAPFDSVARAAERVSSEMGIRSEIVRPAFVGSIESVCERVAARVGDRKSEGQMLIFYGEATISLPKEHGVGGRAQQLALELARSLEGLPISGLVAGTDGIDGNSGAAGAFFTGQTWNDVERLDPEDALKLRDAGSLMRRAGLCIDTGSTGVNHADLILVQRSSFSQSRES